MVLVYLKNNSTKWQNRKLIIWIEKNLYLCCINDEPFCRKIFKFPLVQRKLINWKVWEISKMLKVLESSCPLDYHFYKHYHQSSWKQMTNFLVLLLTLTADGNFVLMQIYHYLNSLVKNLLIFMLVCCGLVPRASLIEISLHYESVRYAIQNPPHHK